MEQELPKEIEQFRTPVYRRTILVLTKLKMRTLYSTN